MKSLTWLGLVLLNFMRVDSANLPELPDDMLDIFEDFNPTFELLDVEKSMGDFVDTTSGIFVGTKTVSKTNKTVKVFYGIPYAKPPVGELRFKPPQPAERKPGLTIADKKGTPCYQHGPTKTMKLLRKLGYSVDPPYSEDCLTLNVWSPMDVLLGHNKPVMVFIHGGEFYLGSSTDYYSDGATLSSEENVIVVSMNYRLGALGFLSLGLRDEAPGNAGLMDQQLAIRWVSDNIAKFGGNPNQVTIFGVNAGATSVGYQLLSPGSRGLFQKAILMSGVPDTPNSFFDPETVKRKSIEVAKSLNYRGTNDPHEVLRFLRSKSAQNINEAADICGDDKFTLGPTVDGVFLQDVPEVAVMGAARDRHLTVMIGSTSDEGAFKFISSYPYLFSRYENSPLRRDDLEFIVRHLQTNLDDDVVESIIEKYIDHTKSPDDPYMLRQAAVEVLGDYLVFCDSHNFADHLSQLGIPVYRYIFDGRADITEGHVPSWAGALHGCEGLLVFGEFLDSDHMASEYLDFVRDMMKKFANFARTGSPNLSVQEARVKAEPAAWPLYDKKERGTMVIRPSGDIEVLHPRVSKCALWRHLSTIIKPGPRDTCSTRKDIDVSSHFDDSLTE